MLRSTSVNRIWHCIGTGIILKSSFDLYDYHHIRKEWVMSKKSTSIPGVTFSWKRALGITKLKQKISRTTGIPMTKIGVERKIGSMIMKIFSAKK